jgi:RNA polymerase sigma-70 factor, ECF subfamily
MTPPPPDVTALLRAWSEGDRNALDRLLPAVYQELHRQAERYMRAQSPGHTLQTTALVHEAYLRLVSREGAEWNGRAHFFGVAAKAMRSILVDHARARGRAKRGGGAAPITLTEIEDSGGGGRGLDVLELDDALARLSELDPRKGSLVELRYFAGLGIEEAAATIGISPATAKREWRLARAWLQRELSGGMEPG